MPCCGIHVVIAGMDIGLPSPEVVGFVRIDEDAGPARVFADIVHGVVFDIGSCT
jgi:hypothetical protein